MSKMNQDNRRIAQTQSHRNRLIVHTKRQMRCSVGNSKVANNYIIIIIVFGTLIVRQLVYHVPGCVCLHSGLGIWVINFVVIVELNILVTLGRELPGHCIGDLFMQLSYKDQL